jgi:hypothetical protein
MYEPNKQDIDDKQLELINDWLADDDQMADALVSNIPLFRALLNARTLDDFIDSRFDLAIALQAYAKRENDFYSDAQDSLIAERGYSVRTAVDDHEFVKHLEF